MEKRIYLSPPHMGGEEQKFVAEAFATNWISPAGPHIHAFEQELAAYNVVSDCAALSSGTAAIHLALIILGVKRSDEVLCATFTFAGSCNPIVYEGATPVFVDSETETWNMDPQLLEDAIKDRMKKGRKPKAIIMVHLYGMPGRIEDIMEISRRFDIPVIEDAAEGLGSSRQGKKLGSFGDMGIYSFNGNKIITTSGGGALVSERGDWVQKVRFLATQARDPAPHYQHSSIGYNYRLSNVCAAIGRGQLKVLDLRVQKKREIFSFYQRSLSSITELTFQPERHGSTSNRWLTCIQLEPIAGFCPDAVRIALEEKNIESRPLWKPMHLQPVFKDAPFYGSNVSERLFNRGLCLPSGSALKEDEMTMVSDCITKTMSKTLSARTK